MKVTRTIGLVLALAASALTGCHGGGSDAQSTVISGMVSKGPISGGTVMAYAVRNGVEDRFSPLGQGTSDSNGNYAVDLGPYTGPVVVEATNGSYTDEVSGATVLLKTPLRVILSNAANGLNTAAITPLTELAYKKARGDGAFTTASIDDANTKISSFFQLNNVISIAPDAAGAGDDQKKYAAILGSISQYVNNNKNQGESVDDALKRLLVSMGDEVENAGGFSIGTISGINAAISDFSNSGKNTTGAAIAPLSLPASGLLKLSSSGTATIGAVDVTVNFPVGVTVVADAASGETAVGVVTASGAGAAGDNALLSAKFTPASGGAPARLHIAMINATGFGPGEFATIKFNLDTGGSFPASASMFSVAGFSAVGTDGSALNGMTASPASVGGELK